MKHIWTLYVSRAEATIYLTAEVGPERVESTIERIGCDDRGRVALHVLLGELMPRSRGRSFRRRDIADYAMRIAQIVAHAEGRLGYAMSSGYLFIARTY